MDISKNQEERARLMSRRKFETDFILFIKGKLSKKYCRITENNKTCRKMAEFNKK
jgi:hypothetical protein